jgi:hypothetical protein
MLDYHDFYIKGKVNQWDEAQRRPIFIRLQTPKRGGGVGKWPGGQSEGLWPRSATGSKQSGAGSKQSGTGGKSSSSGAATNPGGSGTGGKSGSAGTSGEQHSKSPRWT